MPYCNNCGAEYAQGAKFCSECGKPLTDLTPEFPSKRKMVYEGTVHKCPNCGEILSFKTGTCPSCGYEIYSIKGLVAKLEELEKNRKPENKKSIADHIFNEGKLSSLDQQEIRLIKNFIIPNDIEDIVEFTVLAATNVDAEIYGLFSYANQSKNAMNRSLSDAWLVKLEQAHKKAQMLFFETREYMYIDQIYTSKITDIKRKKQQIPMMLLGLAVFYLGMFLLLKLFSG